MNVNVINAFVDSTIKVLKTTASVDATASSPHVRKDKIAHGDVSGIVVLAGSLVGSIALSFTEECILKVAYNMLGQEIKVINKVIQDTTEEITDRISGDARAVLQDEGYYISAQIPSVISGKGHIISHVLGGPSIVIPFITAFGSFVMDICIKEDKVLLIERELTFLGLLDKAREIYGEFGINSAWSYIKSSHLLLRKVYRTDLNPGHEKKAKNMQQRLNHVRELISRASNEELISLLNKGVQEKVECKKKVLVVEDEFGLQETYRDVFIMEGYDVRVAVDGENGYQTFLEFKPDLVFTDVVMPKMSGIKMVRKIRQSNPLIKVIYISGFFGLRHVKQDLDEESSKYGYPCLSKPFKISGMLELMDKYLNDQTEVQRDSSQGL